MVNGRLGETGINAGTGRTCEVDRALLARRLLKARGDAGISRVEAARRAGIADNSIYRYETGRNVPRSEILTSLAREYGRSVGWFLGEVPADTQPAWRFSPAPTGGLETDVGVTGLAVIATVAGSGVFGYDESARYWMPFRQDLLVANGVNPGHSRLVEVKGDSMHPTVKDGALVIVDASKYELRDGHIYLMSAGVEGVVVRRVYQDGRDWVVTGDNPACRPRTCDQQWEVYGEARLAWTALL